MFEKKHNKTKITTALLLVTAIGAAAAFLFNSRSGKKLVDKYSKRLQVRKRLTQFQKRAKREMRLVQLKAKEHLQEPLNRWIMTPSKPSRKLKKKNKSNKHAA